MVHQVNGEPVDRDVGEPVAMAHPSVVESLSGMKSQYNRLFRRFLEAGLGMGEVKALIL
jgi:hypothetical protein